MKGAVLRTPKARPYISKDSKRRQRASRAALRSNTSPAVLPGACAKIPTFLHRIEATVNTGATGSEPCFPSTTIASRTCSLTCDGPPGCASCCTTEGIMVVFIAIMTTLRQQTKCNPQKQYEGEPSFYYADSTLIQNCFNDETHHHLKASNTNLLGRMVQHLKHIASNRICHFPHEFLKIGNIEVASKA